MDDYLVDLLHLTRRARSRPVEDFLSLCLGNLLAQDVDLLAELLGFLTLQDKGAETLPRWRAASDRDVEVVAQLRAESGDRPSAGWVDLRLLLSGPAEQGVIIEAKVGEAAPTAKQIERYAAAFPNDVVVALVQESARSRCPSGVPVLTWDEIAEVLARASAGASGIGRRQFLRLLAHARVIDSRRGLPATAWGRARRANDIYERLLPRLKAMLAALGPNATVRAELAADIERCAEWAEASRGWGPAVRRDRTGYGKSLIRGLSLAVDAGDHADELEWLLEVLPSRKEAGEKLRGDDFRDWMPSKGNSGWFTTRLAVTRGQPKLTKDELSRVVGEGRRVLRELHTRLGGAEWATHGRGDGVPAGQDKPVAELRQGIRDYSSVYAALGAACSQVVAGIASPGAPWDEQEWKRKGYGYVSTKGPTVWAGADPRLGTLTVALLRGSGRGLRALEQAVGEEPPKEGVSLPKVGDFEEAGLKGPGLTVTLNEHNWRDPELVPTLVRIVRRALEILG